MPARRGLQGGFAHLRPLVRRLRLDRQVELAAVAELAVLDRRTGRSPVWPAPGACLGPVCGLALLLAGEQRARELGYRRLLLETGIMQPEAMALYENSGYQRVYGSGHYRNSPNSRGYERVLA